MVSNCKKRFIIIIGVIGIMLFSQATLLVEAHYEKEEPNVVVIYSSITGEITEEHRTLDMLIGHFTKDITFISTKDVTKRDLDGVTHLFYYGQVAEYLPDSFETLFDDYSGSFIAFGYNIEQLGDQFTFVEPLHEVEINKLKMQSSQQELYISPEATVHVNVLEGEIVMEGIEEDGETTYPIAVKSDNNYYVTLDSMSTPKTIMIGEVLHDFFQVSHVDENFAFIRLEDIHPLVDPNEMEAIAHILKEKNIPFMMAVIPVYTNPETGKRYHFSDSPKLLKILKQMQQDGGSVVLHGYTHQFRMSETGEGFEFWDVEQNMPIYADADESFTLRSESDFSSKTKYEQYILQLQKFESEYTRRKINRGIQEMVNYGLYPLAFEAPHYTMSQHGYEVVSDYFSTYVGQIQLSDEDWEVMDTTPYITSPQFLHGIELIPETMSYVKPNDPNSIEKMMRRANNYKKTTDGVLGAFYHPYLGADRFIEVIERMEKIPNISWINLKERDIWVKTEHIYLYTENGKIVTEVNRGKLLLSSIDFPLYHLNKLLKGIIWSIAGISMIAVCAFIHLTIVTYKNNNVQLGSE